ncbi:MAG TPA: geranylgeranyl reductase family protein [Solirubrobacteraceae bacterium]|nr:geranylgeranyl reductase family protein [Solirubrobacteraceae bacterium]
MEDFDALVVGAGPAGSMTAYRLAGAGARVLVVDRARFPREKPCGGAISARAMRELPLDPHAVVEHVADTMELSYRGRRPYLRGGRRTLASLTQRHRLDHFLLEQALHAGAELQDGARVSEISERGACVNGKRVACRLLIGADGANGPTARSLGLAGERVYGVALEGNLAHELLDPERWRSRVVIELGTIPGGYCWIFPKGDHVNVGVGGWESAGPTLRGHLQALCVRRGLDYSKLTDLRGYRLPARAPGAPLARGAALLVGDAAGLLDPLWGDGIYAAFLSSRLAAGAAMELLAGHATGLQGYADAVIRELGLMTAFAWDAKLALDRAPRLALAALLSKPGWHAVENMLRGRTSEPGAESGIAGIALRGFAGVGRRAGWPGGGYRTETLAARQATPQSSRLRLPA